MPINIDFRIIRIQMGYKIKRVSLNRSTCNYLSIDYATVIGTVLLLARLMGQYRFARWRLSASVVVVCRRL